jgi:hypothetical protein
VAPATVAELAAEVEGELGDAAGFAPRQRGAQEQAEGPLALPTSNGSV